MAKDVNRVIEIPEGVEVILEIPKVIVKKDGKELTKILPYSKNIKVVVKENKINIISKNPNRRETALSGTIQAHIDNLIKGVSEGYLYKLEICNVHFPMNVKIEGKNVTIKNFLGEKKDRSAKILEGVEASLKGNIVELNSINKEAVGQSAANIEIATKVRKKDRRVFQDGIYIIEKGGRVI